MKIALFGATGHIGQRVIQEALKRGHSVTAIVRDPSKVTDPRVKAVQGDVTDAARVASAVAGHDAVVNATGSHTDSKIFTQAANALLDELEKPQFIRKRFTMGY